MSASIRPISIRTVIGRQHFPPFLERGDNPGRHVRGLRKLAWRPFWNAVGLSALVGVTPYPRRFGRAARRCLAAVSISLRARVRVPYDAEKLFNRAGIGRRFVSTDRFHPPASSLVNGSFCLATAEQPSEQFALRRFRTLFAVPLYFCRPTLSRHSACATLSTCPRRRRRFCSPRL